MSSIVYSGGTILNSTFTCATGTRAEIVTGLGAALVSAGWTSLGSGLYKSATTASPKSNSIKVQLTDPGSGTCAQVKIQNEANSLISAASFLSPGVGKVYKVIACQYNFFCFVQGATAAREFLCGGTLYIPDFLNGVVTGSLGWLQGNAQADADATVRKSFRTKLSTADSTTVGTQSMIRNGLLLNQSGSLNNSLQNLVVPVNADYARIGSYRWSDDSIGSHEAILSFGIASGTDEAKRQGLIHNCFVSNDSYTVDTIPGQLYDGHHWWGITSSNIGLIQVDARGTLFVAID